MPCYAQVLCKGSGASFEALAAPAYFTGSINTLSMRLPSMSTILKR